MLGFEGAEEGDGFTIEETWKRRIGIHHTESDTLLALSFKIHCIDINMKETIRDIRCNIF